MKQRIVLTESKLRNMIKESVRQILNEMVNEGQGARELGNRFMDMLDVPRYRRDYMQRNRHDASLKNYIKTGSWLGNEDNDLVGYDGRGNAIHKDISKNPYHDWSFYDSRRKPINNSTWGKIGRAAAGTALRLMSPGRAINRMGNQIMNKIRPKT